MQHIVPLCISIMILATPATVMLFGESTCEGPKLPVRSVSRCRRRISFLADGIGARSDHSSMCRAASGWAAARKECLDRLRGLLQQQAAELVLHSASLVHQVKVCLCLALIGRHALY